MRRSFGPPMGGGGGGGMMKTVHRAVRAGIGGGAAQEPHSHPTTTTTITTTNRNQSQNTLSLSSNTNSSTLSSLNHPVPEAAAAPSWAFPTSPTAAAGEEFDWEYVDDGASDGDSVYGLYDDVIFGSVPSKDEVHHAVSSLQEVLDPVSFSQLINDRRTYKPDSNATEKILSPTTFYKSGSVLDWIEPSLQQCNSTSTLDVPDSNRIYDAFHLLHTEPSVQRMVTSLSSDKAVWDAVMNNEVVRELRESINEDKSILEGSEDSVGGSTSNPVAAAIRWIFVNTKVKVIEIVEKITKMVQPMNKEEKAKHECGGFEEKLRSSFFLSVMVLLIVIVTRAHRFGS